MSFKRITLVLAGVVCLSLIAGMGQVQAADSASGKFARGVGNIATGVLEVPYQIVGVSQDENVLMGITVGAIKGVGMTVGRLGSGLFDLLTFFAEPYDAPLIEPEYVWSG
jgi:putative exosortase-associated protein (TIGR04073 family)